MNEGILFYFWNFLFFGVVLLGVFLVYEGVFACFLERGVLSRIFHLTFGVAFTVIGVAGWNFMQGWWREER